MKKDFFYISILIIIAVAIHWIWFDFSTILTASDWNYIPSNVVRESFIAWNTWVPFSGFGSANIQIPFFFFMSIWGIIIKFGFSYDIATKLTFFIPIAILNFISPYLLSRKLFKYELISFTLALFYGTSIYGIANQPPIQFVYAIAPLLLLLLINAFEKRSLFHWLLFSILYSIGIFYEVRIMYVLTVVFIIYILLVHLKKLQDIKIVTLAACAGVVILLLNMFWVLPLLFGAGGSNIQAVANRGLFGNNLADTIHAFALSPWYWTGDTPNNKFQIQPVLWYLWFTPLFAFSVLLIKNKSRNEKIVVIFFSIISLLGIFLTKQTYAPFPSIYEWLYVNFPGFNIFRESSKFYLITALGYFGLMGALLSKLVRSEFKIKRVLFISIISVISIVSIINSLPLVNGNIGGLFVNRTEPDEYLTLNKFLSLQAKDTYFRTYWVPRDSHWGYYDMNTPKMSGIDTINSIWGRYIVSNPINLIQENIIDIFNYSYSEKLLDISTIKYIIVPLRDITNDDDFFVYYDGGIKDKNIRDWYVEKLDKISYLKKIDLGTPNIDIYENTDYQQYISTFDKLTILSNQINFNEKYDFFNDVLGNGSYYVMDSQNKLKVPGTGLTDIFDSLSISNIHLGESIITSSSTISSSAAYKSYRLNDTGTSYAVINNSNLEIYRDSGTLTTATSTSLNSNKLISSVKVPSGYGNYLTINGALFQVAANEKTILGNIDSDSVIEVYTMGENLVQNGSFKDGLWQETVGDCNNYDSNPDLRMSLSSTSFEGDYSLELQATKHIACVGSSLKTNAGLYVFSFYAKGFNQTQARYYLSLEKAGKTTPLSKYVALNGNSWTRFETLVNIPNDQSNVGITLYGLSSDQKTNVITHYDEVVLSKLDYLGQLNISDSESYIKSNLNPTSDIIDFSYFNTLYNFKNLVQNGSFENGLWQKTVGDCANYDSNPKLDISLDHSNASNADTSLQIEATRHFACTNTNVPVQGGLTYMFTFDYMSENSPISSYYLGFNDASSTNISENILIKDSKWHTYTKLIKVPYGATGVSIVLYAKEKDKVTNIINNYDNVSLVQIPDLSNVYYLIATPNITLIQEPESITFDSNIPTKKLVHVKNATTGFFLAMSEAWHPSWQLEMNNSRTHGILSAWTPFAYPDKVPDDQHFELNGFLNGWYVDVYQLCEVDHVEGCFKNADGSYDLEMQIEFWPQRWFYVGLVISGVTLAAVLGYLGYSLVQRRKLMKSERVTEIV